MADFGRQARETRVSPRERRNSQRWASVEGVVVAPLSINDQGQMELVTGAGTAVDGDTLVVDLATDPGLEFVSGDLKALVQDVLAIDASGIKLNYGTGLEDSFGTGVLHVTLDPFDTDDLDEGLSNLYFTDERAQDAAWGIVADSASVGWTYNDAGNAVNAVVLPGGVNHNKLQNYVASKHVDHSAVSITAGDGLTGGGTIAATRNLSVDLAAVNSHLHFLSGKLAVKDDYVLNTGDAMTGALTLPADGLTVDSASNQLVAANGKVGIGTNDPEDTLDLRGTAGIQFGHASAQDKICRIYNPGNDSLFLESDTGSGKYIDINGWRMLPAGISRTSLQSSGYFMDLTKTPSGGSPTTVGGVFRATVQTGPGDDGTYRGLTIETDWASSGNPDQSSCELYIDRTNTSLGGGTHNVMEVYVGGSLTFSIDSNGDMVLQSYTNALRPAAGKAGRMIFNTDDGQLNIDDGTDWTLPDGTTT